MSNVARGFSDLSDATVCTGPVMPHGLGSGKGLPDGLARKPIPLPSSCTSVSSYTPLASLLVNAIMLGLASTRVTEVVPPVEPSEMLLPKTSRAAHRAGVGPAPKSSSDTGMNPGARTRSSCITRT